MSDDESTQSPAVRKANLHFRKEAQSRERTTAWAEHNAEEAAVRERTARLKEERLAREAAAPKPAPVAAPVKKKAAVRSKAK